MEGCYGGSQSDPGGEGFAVEWMARLELGGHDEANCKYYLRAGFCEYGARCRFNHPPDRTTEQPKEELEELRRVEGFDADVDELGELPLNEQFKETEAMRQEKLKEKFEELRRVEGFDADVDELGELSRNEQFKETDAMRVGCGVPVIIRNLQSELAAANNRANYLQKQLAEANNRANNLQKQLAEANNRANNLQNQLAEANNRANYLQNQLDGCWREKKTLEDEVAQLKTDTVNSQNMINRLNTEMAKKDADTLKYQADKLAAENRIQTLLEPYITTLINIMNANGFTGYPPRP